MSDLGEMQIRNDAESFDLPRLQHRAISYINIQGRSMRCEIFMQHVRQCASPATIRMC